MEREHDPQSAITYSQSAAEMLEQGVKYVHS